MKRLAMSLVLAVSAVAATSTPVVAQQPATPAGPQTPAAGDQKPAVPYKPDFVIPKPEGPTSGTAQQPPAASGPAGPGYVIGIGDNLQITVVGEADLSNKFRVDSDGTITYPFLGRVTAAGTKIGDFQDRIRDLLKKDFLKNPEVRIDIDQYKSRSVFVTGEVRAPNRYVMSGTQMTLLEALAMAGGPTSSASTQVNVQHASQPDSPVLINLKELQLGKSGSDIAIEDGDVINVPPAQRFYISGQVKNGGTYIWDPGMTVGQAIALAGGLSERGSDRRMKAKRVVDGKPTEVDVKNDDKVLPNDQINVPSRLF